MYIRECTKILKYKDFSKYPRPLGPPASPPFGDVAGARAGTCRWGWGCGRVGVMVDMSSVTVGISVMALTATEDLRAEGRKQLDAWIEQQVADGKMIRRRDGTLTHPRRRVHSVAGARLSLAAIEQALAAAQHDPTDV